MSNEVSWLLTDEFVSFSSKIAAIHEEKKIMKQQLKELYEKTTNEIKELDAKAAKLEQDFQNWKKSKEEKNQE